MTENWNPEILVRVYRGDHLIEQRFCENAETVGNIVESWEARPQSEDELIVIEPHPPETIVSLLRAVADAIELERPLSMPHPFPNVRLQLVVQGADHDRSRPGQLNLLWQERAHPGG